MNLHSDNTALHGAAKLKPNWSCTLCGMYSSRRYSVSRHVKNMHGGEGAVIPFIEYLVGRRSGNYPPGPKPSFASTDISDIGSMVKEAIRLEKKRIVEQSVPPLGDPYYIEAANIIKNAKLYLYRKEQLDLQKDSSPLESING
jgi:hypothetical protein